MFRCGCWLFLVAFVALIEAEQSPPVNCEATTPLQLFEKCDGEDLCFPAVFRNPHPHPFDPNYQLLNNCCYILCTTCEDSMCEQRSYSIFQDSANATQTQVKVLIYPKEGCNQTVLSTIHLSDCDRCPRASKQYFRPCQATSDVLSFYGAAIISPLVTTTLVVMNFYLKMHPALLSPFYKTIFFIFCSVIILIISWGALYTSLDDPEIWLAFSAAVCMGATIVMILLVPGFRLLTDWLEEKSDGVYEEEKDDDQFEDSEESPSLLDPPPHWVTASLHPPSLSLHNEVVAAEKVQELLKEEHINYRVLEVKRIENTSLWLKYYQNSRTHEDSMDDDLLRFSNEGAENIVRAAPTETDSLIELNPPIESPLSRAYGPKNIQIGAQGFMDGPVSAFDWLSDFLQLDQNETFFFSGVGSTSVRPVIHKGFLSFQGQRVHHALELPKAIRAIMPDREGKNYVFLSRVTNETYEKCENKNWDVGCGFSYPELLIICRQRAQRQKTSISQRLS